MSTVKATNIQEPNSATVNMVLNTSGAVAVGQNLSVAGTTTLTGSLASTLNLVAGTTTVAPLDFATGTNLTTAIAGGMEYDGTVFYATPTASQRGVIMAEQIILLQSAYTLTAQTAAQKLFNTPTNGQVTLSVGTYEFECFYSLSSLSSTAGTFGFALGGTATFTQFYLALARKDTSVLTPSTTNSTYNTAANTNISGSNTATLGLANISGIINVSVTGTVIPQISLSVGTATPIVGVGSYFRIRPIGSTTVTSVGNWS